MSFLKSFSQKVNSNTATAVRTCLLRGRSRALKPLHHGDYPHYNVVVHRFIGSKNTPTVSPSKGQDVLKKDVLDITLNCIWWWDSSFRHKQDLSTNGCSFSKGDNYLLSSNDIILLTIIYPFSVIHWEANTSTDFFYIPLNVYWWFKILQVKIKFSNNWISTNITFQSVDSSVLIRCIIR